MFDFEIEENLDKKLRKLAKKDKKLLTAIKRKISEVISHDFETIHLYKNLKSPKNEFKRIHITGEYILLFKVYVNRNIIVFVDILHRDVAYK